VELSDVVAQRPDCSAELSSAGHLGIRPTSLSTLPARGAGRRPEHLCRHVGQRALARRCRRSPPRCATTFASACHALTGLRVAEVRITVTDLLTDPPDPSAVRQ